MRVFYLIIISIFIQINSLDKYENQFYEKVKIEEIIQELESEKLSKNETEQIIKNIISLLDRYVFIDIAKNPPQPDGYEKYHESFNMIEELNKINTEDRTFYDFYRDIRIVFGKTKDLHLSMSSKITYSFCFPLKFIVKKTNEIFRIYAEIKEECSDSLDEETRKTINNNKNISINLIKDKDPFDYIQNYNGYFRTLRNKHSQFSLNLRMISEATFSNYPFLVNDLTNITINYLNGDNVTLDYLGIKPNKTNEEFYTFYTREMIKDIDNSIFQLKNNFLEKKGKKLISDSKEIKWDVTTEDKYFKCRVDNEKKVNVFYQSSFSLNFEKTPYVFYKCFSLFNENNYPIIGIENENGGGIVELSVLLQNLLQPKIAQNLHFSMKHNDKIKFAYGSIFNETTNIENCETYNNPDELFEKNETDDYGNNVLHNRTIIFNFGMSKTDRLTYNNNRYYYFKNNLRKSTDILIFTDSFSYSATSVFIKGLQNTGGAIIVGFNGNPTLKEEPFDASQSPSFILPHFTNCILEDGKCVSCDDNDLYEIYEEKKICMIKDSAFKPLFEKGFYFVQLTIVQTYDDNYLNNTFKYKVPREYLIDPIDERSDLYNKYTDERYEEFIDEAKRILKKYEINCNANNEKLVKEDENCAFDDDKYAHGGYSCENGEWSKNCKPYYCDIGYYFDQYKKKCIKDPCYLETQYIEGEYNKNITVKEDETILLSFLNPNYTYFLISDKDIIYDEKQLKTKFYAINPGYFQSKNVFLKSHGENANVQIKSYQMKVNVRVIKNEKDFEVNDIFLVNNETNQEIIFFESDKDYVYFIGSEDGNSKIYGRVYNDDIQPEDIIKINQDKFNETTNKIITINKNTLYILIKNISDVSSLNYLFQPLEIKDNEFRLRNDKKKYFVYLQKNNTYKLIKNNVLEKAMLKLSRKTLDSELTIKEDSINEEKKVNKENLYYEISSNVEIYVNNSDSLLEFQYKNNKEIPKLDETSKTKYQLNNDTEGNAFIIFNPKEKDLKLEILLESENEFNFNFFSGFAKLPYFYIPKDYNEKKVKKMTLMIQNPFSTENITLYNDENFVVLISVKTNDVKNKIFLSYNYTLIPEKNSNHIWLIILIVTIVLIIIGFVAYLIMSKRKKTIEDIDNLTI